MKNRFFIEDDDPFFSSGLWQPDRKNKTEDHISRHIVTPATHDKIYVAPSLFDQDHTGTPSESVSVPILQPVAEADPSASLQTANIANISALADANRRWDDNAVLGDALTLYYSIPDVMPSYSTGVTPLPFPTAHRNAIREIIGQTEALTNLTFVEVPTAQSAHVAFFYSDLDPGIAGGAYYPYAYETGSYVGDIFIDIAYTNNPPASAGDFQYHVIMHELGHALGLKHPFADTPNLPANEDNTNYTVMSYTRYLPYPSTYSIYDIAALQYLYGANASTNAGDTIYDLSLLLGTRQTIWDGGGIDTYDGSSLSHALYIDIAEGAFSTIDAVDNLATAFGAEIENVIGGSAGDSILGNGLDNEIIGGQGDDFLDGAGGTDEAVYSGHYADYTVNVSGGAGTITDNVGSDGTDTVINLERLIFANGVFENGVFTPNYVGPTIINGTPGNDVPLDGTSGDDIISGLDGADVIHGLAGNDQIDGGGWNDEIYGGDDNDTIFGDWGHDFIEGGPGNDDMDGGVGYDIVSYRSAPSGITIDLRLSTPQDTGGAGIDTIVNFRAVRGSDYGDVITGDDTQNDLLGFDGDDTITGLRGNDTIHGGAGYDTAVFSGYYAQYTLTDFGDYITIEDRFGTDGTDVLYGIEALQFSDGTFAPFDPLPAGSPIFGYTTNDTINGDNNDNLIYGLWGIDTIHGLGGSDTIYGGEQGDLIFGDEGNDFLYGFHGSDIMDGGPGDDLIDGQSGFNTASYQSATSGVTVDLSIIGPQDTIGAGVDTLVQMKGLIGSDYADILYGNVLLNHIDGGAGDDWIAPGKADDIITGGAGADTIYLHADDVRWGFNTITDFNPGEGDALDIADVLFGYDALTNAITDFVTVTDNGVDSTVIVDQDGAGTQYAAKTIAVLQNITGLSDVEGLETAGTLITV